MTAKFQFNTSSSKTYATEKNADKAVADKGFENLRHFMMRTDDGRWFPVFTGRNALDHGVHFHFHIVG
jgi:hypothetical protein